MEILRIEHDPSLLMMAESGEDRPEGVHLSDILVRRAWERDKKYHPDAPMDLQNAAQGFVWETVLGRALAFKHGAARAGSRPAPLREDGIWLSPDWVGFEGKYRIHEEWKATKKSIKSADVKISEWAPQARSYLRAMNRRKIIDIPDITRFRVWFINGDYSYEAKTDAALLRDYYIIDVRFDRREQEEEWTKVVTAGVRYGLLTGGLQSWGTTKTATSSTSENRPVKSVVLRGQTPTGQQGMEEKPWDVRPTLEKTLRNRSERRGNPPQKSRTPAEVVTFPTSRKKLFRRVVD